MVHSKARALPRRVFFVVVFALRTPQPCPGRGPLPPELELPLELLDALPQLVQAPHHHVPVEAAGGATVQATGGALASTSPPLTVVTPIPRSPLSSPLSSPHSSSHPSATQPASSPAPHSLSSPPLTGVSHGDY